MGLLEALAVPMLWILLTWVHSKLPLQKKLRIEDVISAYEITNFGSTNSAEASKTLPKVSENRPIIGAT
jgi:hypothetical protein